MSLYGFLSGYIQQYPLNLGFCFRPLPLASEEKKCLCIGTILLYIALQNTIYTLHMPLMSMKMFMKMFIFAERMM